MKSEQVATFLGLLQDYKAGKIDAVAVLNYVILILERKWEQNT